MALKEEYSFVGTEMYNEISPLKMLDLYDLKLDISDIKKVNQRAKNKSIRKVIYYVSPELCKELHNRKLYNANLLSNSIYGYYGFHKDLFFCKRQRAFVYTFGGAWYLDFAVKRACDMIYFCPVCNTLFRLYLYIRYDKEVRNDFRKILSLPKGMFFYISNIAVPNKLVKRKFFLLLLDLILKKTQIEYYLYAVRPSFNRPVDKNSGLYDIIFVPFFPIERISLQSATSMYLFFEVLFEELSKDYLNLKKKISLNFDFYFYSFDYDKIDFLDVLNLVYYFIDFSLYKKISGQFPSLFEISNMLFMFNGYTNYNDDRIFNTKVFRRKF